MAECRASVAASLKKRLTIQNVARTPDGQGGFTETWADAATVYASLEPVKSYERYQAMQLAAPVSHTVVMRYTPAVTARSRLAYGDRVFNVKEVINQMEENRFLTIKAVEA